MLQVISDGLSVLTRNWPVVLSALGVVCLGCGVVFFLFSRAYIEDATPCSLASLILLPLFFVLSVILRLAFVTATYVPPYIDSVEHYRIIRELATAYGSSTLFATLPRLTAGYYHLGFHFLASLLTFGLRANPIDVILVLGQVILAAIPVPVFFLVRDETKSEIAGFFGMLLAGFGWYMPGFAVNWGKYPALAGLLAFELALSVAYLLSRKKRLRDQYALPAVLVLGIFISTLVHSRALVIIAISFTSWIVASRIYTLPRIFKSLLSGVLLVGVLTIGVMVQGETLLKLALEPYFGDGFWITLLVLALGPFALKKFSQGVYFCILFVLCIFTSLFIPVGGILPGFVTQTLLDRPFVEMVLYFPLSVLGGLGLAGILQALNDIRIFSNQMRLYARVLTTLLLIGIGGILPMGRYNFYPSECCNFMGYEDTVVIDWLNRNLPSDALILIASTEMNVLPSGPSASIAGTDAGIWIPQLTGRDITLMPFDIDFRSTDTVDLLCQKQIGYIYIGSAKQSFKIAQLLERANLYEGVLHLPNVQLYRLIGCSPID